MIPAYTKVKQFFFKRSLKKKRARLLSSRLGDFHYTIVPSLGLTTFNEDILNIAAEVKYPTNKKIRKAFIAAAQKYRTSK